MRNLFVIDIGSNSIRMLHARMQQGKVKSINKWLIRAGLGEKKGADLTQEAIERGVDAVVKLREKALAIDPEAPIMAFATSAVREAPNRKVLLEKISRRTGILVCVLSGKEEALIGAEGALGEKDGCMIDIGGGSTELVVRYNGKICCATSLDIGCVRAKSLFAQQDDIQAEAWAKQAFLQCRIDRVEQTVAIGGTPTALAACALQLKEYDPQAVDGFILTRAKLDELYKIMAPLDAQLRAQRYCMDEKRAEIILYGLMILRAFMDTYHIEQVRVSEADNLEGYLLFRKDQLEK